VLYASFFNLERLISSAKSPLTSLIAYFASLIQDQYLGFYKSLLENHLPLTPAFVCNCDRVAFRIIAQPRKPGYAVPEDNTVMYRSKGKWCTGIQ